MSQKKENWTQLLENSLFSHVLTSPVPGKYERRLAAERGKRGEQQRESQRENVFGRGSEGTLVSSGTNRLKILWLD